MDCHCIEGIRDENGLVESKHPVVMDCGRKSQFRNLRFIGQSNLHLQILWEIAVPMQELGAGRCLDGSQTSLDLFVEGFTWMINI